MLYVCPECGDIQCGAMTVEITKTGNTYTWQNFGSCRESGGNWWVA
jgi:hypothetical protein